jgi:hypothetical protein
MQIGRRDLQSHRNLLKSSLVVKSTPKARRQARPPRNFSMFGMPNSALTEEREQFRIAVGAQFNLAEHSAQRRFLPNIPCFR